MVQPRRLFDCVDYQLEKFDKQDMLAAKENGHGANILQGEVKEKVNNLSAGLLQLSVNCQRLERRRRR